ncbi:MAG: phosphoesterase [Legionellales bacterium RIFCSPHIGHO2_12_FULL_35_11]|nr:MAG: phosphoesterase [Legionellales bacterium RIFCSPHIGHO2_12_FULL_35_11]
MPDLSHEASLEYWSEYNDPSIYRVITFMESVESWSLDGNPALEEGLKELGKQLDDIESVDMDKLGHEELFIKLAGNIKTGRGLRLLQAIDQVHPGSASKVLVHAEETSVSSNDHAGFFLKRNIVFERLRLLSRTFSDARLKLIERALEGDE